MCNPTVPFCLSATVSLYLSLTSGKEVFSPKETDHHAAQHAGHLGAAHHRLAVAAADHNSTQTTPNTQTPHQGQIPGPKHTGDRFSFRTSDMLSARKLEKENLSYLKIKDNKIEVTSRKYCSGKRRPHSGSLQISDNDVQIVQLWSRITKRHH